jgi:thiamine-phosphate pyrophosphorylase
VTLPPLLIVTNRHHASVSVVDVVDIAVRDGAPGVIFRDKDLPADERHRLGRQVAERVHRWGATLIVASDVALARALGADAVHLAANDPTTTAMPFGRSCHNADELALAAEEGALYATLSPIFVSTSKPGYGPPLGVEALRDTPLPVYALGGVTAENAKSCRVAGASGVAVMGDVMGAEDVNAHVKSLLAGTV